MNKKQILSFIQEQVEEGDITREELNQFFDTSSTSKPAEVQVSESKDDHAKKLTNVFYGIGAIIVLAGIVILIAQNWSEIGFVGRIGVTLGVSLVSYIIGFLLKDHEQKIISPLAFVLSAVLAPLGAYVLLDEFSIDISLTTQLAMATILTLLFANALLITKKNILILITIFYSSWLYVLALTKLFDLTGYIGSDWMKWAFMFLGVAYLLIGYGLTNSKQITSEDRKEKNSVQRVLYAFGTLGILSAGIAIGGFFDLLFIAVIFGMFYLSVYIKSREMLGISAVFLMAHIIKLTIEYFADIISWPIALIGVGCMIMSIGYATFYINKNYLSKNN